MINECAFGTTPSAAHMLMPRSGALRSVRPTLLTFQGIAVSGMGYLTRRLTPEQARERANYCRALAADADDEGNGLRSSIKPKRGTGSRKTWRAPRRRKGRYNSMISALSSIAAPDPAISGGGG